jgi:uncharacterized protein
MNDSDIKTLNRSLSSKELQLILLPTEQCNFRCTYCYEDFSIGKMKPRIVSALKLLIANRVKTIKTLDLEWFGGEPLAAREIVVSLSEFAKQVCTEKSVQFSGGVTTNGYLLSPPLAERLADFNIHRYQISLDGAGPAHDTTRRLASGKGTFARIWANLLALRRSNTRFAITLRLHLTIDNFESMRILAEMIRQEFLHDTRFTTFIKPVGNWGGPNSSSIRVLSKLEAAAQKAEIESILHSRIPPPPPPQKPGVTLCYASRPNSLVVRADGRIQKCTVAFDKDYNTVGQLADDGSINLNPAAMRPWMRGFETLDAAELHCPATNFPAVNKKIIPIEVLA